VLRDLIGRARAIGHHVIIAVIDADQAGSIKLHQQFRFQKVGRFKEVGFKLGRWLDVVYMELVL
jgi:phosphinothricin acetyltransferase